MNDPVVFSINAADEIVRVNDAWTQFALENDAPELVAERVLGQPLWQYLSDATTRLIYLEIVGQVRAGRTVRFQLRCDAPRLQRRLDMVVAPGDERTVQFESRLVEATPTPPRQLWSRQAVRSTALLRACSWCKRLEYGPEWLHVEAAIAPLGLFEGSPPPAITHGICPDCVREMNGLLDFS